MPLPLIPIIIAATAIIAGCKGEETKTSAARKGFVDGLDSMDRDRWEKSNGWSNGDPFYCGWRSDHVTFADGKMALTLDNAKSADKPYTSGEFRTSEFYGYGTLEASIRAASGEGVVAASLFFHTGPYDKNPHDEIDVEIIKGKLQVNYYVNGKGGNEKVIELGFDPSRAFHAYKIDWRPDSIIWYVDDKEVHRVNASAGPLPKTPGRIIMNLWPGTGVDNWLGKFEYRAPLIAEYDWIKYTPFSGTVVEPAAKTKIPGQTMLAEAIEGAFPFNGAQAAVLKNGINFSAKNANDPGLTMPLKKGTSGKLSFEHAGTVRNEWGDGFFSVLFIGAGEKLLQRKDLEIKADVQKAELDIPEGTVKINLMTVGKSSADVQLTNVVVKEKKD